MTVASDVAVVVVNWNSGDLLRRCLESVRSATATWPGTRIVVVDNGSTDDSLALALAEDPALQVVRLERNLGFAAGANAGIRASDAAFIVLLNNDATMEPGFLEGLLEPFAGPEGDHVGATTGRVLLAGRFVEVAPSSAVAGVLRSAEGRAWRRVAACDPGEQLVNSTGNEVSRSGNGRDRDWLSLAAVPHADRDVFGFNGGCAALRRAALDDVGLLDSSLFMYYEDTELSWRLRRMGWQVRHAPTAVSIHLHAASSGTNTPFFLRLNTRNRLVVAIAHAPWAVVSRAVARTLVRVLLGPERTITLKAFCSAARAAPHALRRRAEIDRAARTSRRTVARYLVDD